MRTSALILLALISANSAVAGPIKIGVIAPLTGPVASWGTDTQRALTLANESFGAGRFEFIFEDGQCLGKEAAAAAQKLVSVDKVHFGMVVCTEEMQASAPIFDRGKVTVVAPGATAASISGISPYVFRTWPSDAFGAQLITKYIKGKHSKVGVFSEGRGLPQEFAKAFTAAAEMQAMVVVNENYFGSDREFKSALLRLSSKGIEGLLVNSDSESTFVNVLKQLHELRISLPFYGNMIGSSQAFRSLAGELANNLVYYDVPVLSQKGQDSEILTEFEKRFGTPNSSIFMVASAISSFRAIVEASKSPTDPRSVLLSNEFESAIGKFRFDKNGDVVGVLPSLKTIKDGKVVEIK